MKRETLLTVTVVLLLALNFGILGYLFLGGGKHPPHPQNGGGPQVDKIIVGTLHYTAEQQKQFDKLKHEHHEQMMQLDREYGDKVLAYFNLLKTDSALAQQKDSLEAALAQIQTNKASITYKHFEDLRALCTPEQRKNFNLLIPEITRIILPPKPPHHPR